MAKKPEIQHEDFEAQVTFTDEDLPQELVEDEPVVTVTDLDPEPPVVTSTPVFRRLSLNNPPPEMAHLPRSVQKPLIAKANALQEQGIDADEAVRQVTSQL